jgi:hypothetical protein
VVLDESQAIKNPEAKWSRAVAMNCGNYRKPGLEQSRVAGVVLTEVVLPSFV